MDRNNLNQLFTPAVVSIKSAISTAASASAPPNKSYDNLLPGHRKYVNSEPTKSLANMNGYISKASESKTPSPPQRSQCSVQPSYSSRANIRADPYNPTNRLKFSTDAKGRFVSGARSIFETPSQSTDDRIDKSSSLSCQKNRLQRLQATGLLDTIRNMQLNDVTLMDEKDEDNYSSGKSSCGTTVVREAPSNIQSNRFECVPSKSVSAIDSAAKRPNPPVDVIPCENICHSTPSIDNAARKPNPSNDVIPSENICHSTPSIDLQAKKYRGLKTVQVNKKIYFYLSSLGQGGSSKVYQVYDPEMQQNRALKIVDLKNADKSVRAGYENEITLLTKLAGCKRVVKLYDYERVMLDNVCRRLLLVMEKGDADLGQILANSIEKDPNSPLGLKIDPHTIKFYWKEMLLAVKEIHEKDVVHADLKPVNFIAVSGKLKLIDFGIANAIETDHTSIIKDNQIGTINFMAPEALSARNDIQTTSSNKAIIKFNCKADIWSLGCILYNLVYGTSPFSKFSSTLAKMSAIVDTNYQIQFPPNDDQDLLDCLKKCLSRDPKSRPTADELLQHPYLTRTGSNFVPSKAISSVGTQAILKDIYNKVNTFTPTRLNQVSKLVRDLSHK